MNFVIKLFFLFKTVKSRSLQNFRQQIFIKINWQNVSLVSSVFCNNVNKSWNHEYVSSDLRKEITWLRRDHNHRVRNLTTERDAATLLRLYFGLFFITIANRRLLNTNFFYNKFDNGADTFHCCFVDAEQPAKFVFTVLPYCQHKKQGRKFQSVRWQFQLSAVVGFPVLDFQQIAIWPARCKFREETFEKR